MKWRRRVYWLIVLLAYLVTWRGGYSSHARELENSAQARYQITLERNAKLRACFPTDGEFITHLGLREGGPKTGTNWCIPLLPGILLVDSYEELGPLYGRGMVKIVFYYGMGSEVICELWGWMS